MKPPSVKEQVARLAASKALHGSDSLCRLLQYLADHALERPGLPLKEYQIATELYGRPPDFDPQTDSMVRVRAGRLRLKLAEYYKEEGAADPLVIDLPKGSYLLKIHLRSGNGASADQEGVKGVETAQSGMVSRRAFLLVVVPLSALVTVLLTVSVLLMRQRSGTEIAPALGSAPRALANFWNGFERGPDPPWIIFSNAAFVGRPDLGLRYYDAKSDAKSAIFDHYTGVGEVLGVHALDTVFTELHKKVRVKRGNLFTLDEAKSNDLVFIGSPSENLSLLDIPGSREFQFRAVPQGPRKGNMEIVNTHPQAGEAAEFLASPSGAPLTEDYAIIALMRGLDHEHSVLILAGTTTFGTQGAVEYVSNEETLELLLSRLAVSKPSELKPFEALIHVKVTRGVPVESELIAIRKGGSL